jgi:hypothetical protein
VPSMANVPTPHVSPVEGLEDAKDMKTPTTDSPKILPGGQIAPPVVTGGEPPPMGGELTADEISIYGKETALMAVASASVSKLSTDMEWVVDSGASAHITKDRSMFVSYVPVRGTVECGATEHRSIGMGTVRLVIEDTDGRDRVIYLKDVIYVPDFKFNLLSLRKAVQRDNLRIEFDEDDCLVTHKEHGYSAFAPVSDQMGLYVLPTRGKERAYVATQTEGTNKLMLWHRRQGHPGRTAMKELYEIYLRKRNRSLNP